MKTDQALEYFDIPESNLEPDLVKPQGTGKTYPFEFNEVKGKKGELCYHMNYGIDTYRSGCYHDCLYCFSKQLNKERSLNNWKINDVSVIDAESVDRQFRDAFDTGKRATKVTSILRQGMPIKIGRYYDPFQSIEQDLKAYFEILKS
jgi:DNA repair photolyase